VKLFLERLLVMTLKRKDLIFLSNNKDFNATSGVIENNFDFRRYEYTKQPAEIFWLMFVFQAALAQNPILAVVVFSRYN
jgi:hypothetical protein